METAALLHLQNLKISFRNPDKKWVTALKGIDLEIKKGEVLGYPPHHFLIGSNPIIAEI